MPTVFANGRSIVHAGDGQVDITGPPDVCKTPSPAGPVPVPYVNIAKSSDLADGTKSVKIEGSSVAIESSSLSTSSGDEPGSAGGIISSKTKGKLTWKTKSLDVRFEGKPVVRFGDVTLHNGNTFNTALAQRGGLKPTTGWKYGDDDDKCALCEKDPSNHKHLEENDQTKAKANELAQAIKSNNLFVRDDKTPFQVDGYMIAVVQCSCHPNVQVYASSGRLPIVGFEGAMGGGWICANESVGQHNLRNFKGKCKQADARDLLSHIKEKIAESRKGKSLDSFNSPGTCAGPKAINKAHANSHNIKHMTEQFVTSRAGESMEGTVEYKIIDGKNGQVATVAMTFKDLQTVPSCGTCKILIMAMLCCDEEKPCQAK